LDKGAPAAAPRILPIAPDPNAGSASSRPRSSPAFHCGSHLGSPPQGGLPSAPARRSRVSPRSCVPVANEEDPVAAFRLPLPGRRRRVRFFRRGAKASTGVHSGEIVHTPRRFSIFSFSGIGPRQCPQRISGTECISQFSFFLYFSSAGNPPKIFFPGASRFPG
jgi:hypothetical protein